MHKTKRTYERTLENSGTGDIIKLSCVGDHVIRCLIESSSSMLARTLAQYERGHAGFNCCSQYAADILVKFVNEGSLGDFGRIP